MKKMTEMMQIMNKWAQGEESPPIVTFQPNWT